MSGREPSRRVLVGVAVAVAALLWLVPLAGELLLPPYLEQRVEDRLTEGGGSASVSIEALPAVRLLARDGDRLGIEGRDLRLDLVEQGRRAWRDIDGFDEVLVRLTDARAGPFDVSAFDLERGAGSDTYRFAMRATVSTDGLAEYAAGAFGAQLSDFAGALGVPTERRVPIDVDLRVKSVDGRPKVVSGKSTVAGFRADLVVEAVAGAIIASL